MPEPGGLPASTPPVTPVVRWEDGWRWLHAGYRIYRRNPFLMAFWVMTYWTLLGLAGLIPIAGDLLVAMLAPVLLIGLFTGCRELMRESMPLFTAILAGFGARLQPLMGLGILHFLLTLGALALTAVGDGGILLQYLARTTLGAQDLPMPDPEQLSLVGLALALLAYVPVMLAFAYAPLLVAWRDFTLGKALFFSLVGSWRAWRGLIGFVAAILAYGVLLPAVIMAALAAVGFSEALLTAWVVVTMLGILAPIVAAGFYSSYEAVLPVPQPADREGAR